MNKGLKSLLIIPLTIIASIPVFFLFSNILAMGLEELGLKTKKQNLGDSSMELMVYFLCLVFTFLIIRHKPRASGYILSGLIVLFLILLAIYVIFFPNPPQPNP